MASATPLLPSYAPDSASPSRSTTLQPLLAPKAIAVIGAARRETAMGHQILSNLITYGFTGAVYPVNPRAHALCSIRAVPTIGAIAEPIDLAVVVVPKEEVASVAQQCGEAGVKGLVVISAGFRETGPDGRAREHELMRVVRQYGMRLVGPNCMGIINTDPAISMNATFATVMPPCGHAAFVSQSGALGLSVLDYAREYGIGIAQFVSVGNKPDVSGNDLLSEWEHDPAVDVILMYVENFGNPQKFLELASRITKVKPIIAVKAGFSRAGARAASSHTGALAADDVVVATLLAQAGVLRARTVEELFDMAIAFGVRARPRSRRTAVLTNAGGPGILAADAMEGAGLDLVELSPGTVEALRPLFPTEASIRNPLDMVASATPANYQTALTALLADPGIDAVVPIFVPPFGIRQDDVAEAIVRAAATQPAKPVLGVLMGLEGLPQGRAELHKAGIPTYIFPESAARALAALNHQAEWSKRPQPRIERLDADLTAAKAILETVRGEQREWLTPIEALRLLDAYHIPTAEARAATDVESVLAAAAVLGYPLVLKVMSPDIVHKSDIGGVRTGIRSEPELRAAFTELTEQVHTLAPHAQVRGTLVQRMLPGHRETIAGITRDSIFGALVMFGLGGIFVEILSDVVFRIAPIDQTQALEMIHGIRGARLLSGVRGEAPVDCDALAAVLRRLGQLATDFPDISELDVNPLILSQDGAVAADVRVRLGAA
jgi:acetyl coenzyme A synthetase (ADP forming)-like protein